MARAAKQLLQLSVSSGLAIVAVYILQQGRQFREGRFIHTAVFGDAIKSARFQLIQGPASLRRQ